MSKRNNKNDIDDLPHGWRKLEMNEVRIAGDQYLLQNRWNPSELIGHPITTDGEFVIRNIEHEKELAFSSPKKKKPHTFNQLSLVPSSLLKGVQEFFCPKSSKEKVADYLKKIKQNEISPV
jgi:hypothetical protein